MARILVLVYQVFSKKNFWRKSIFLLMTYKMIIYIKRKLIVFCFCLVQFCKYILYFFLLVIQLIALLTVKGLIGGINMSDADYTLKLNNHWSLTLTSFPSRTVIGPKWTEQLSSAISWITKRKKYKMYLQNCTKQKQKTINFLLMYIIIL